MDKGEVIFTCCCCCCCCCCCLLWFCWPCCVRVWARPAGMRCCGSAAALAAPLIKLLSKKSTLSLALSLPYLSIYLPYQIRYVIVRAGGGASFDKRTPKEIWREVSLSPGLW